MTQLFWDTFFFTNSSVIIGRREYTLKVSHRLKVEVYGSLHMAHISQNRRDVFYK